VILFHSPLARGHERNKPHAPSGKEPDRFPSSSVSRPASCHRAPQSYTRSQQFNKTRLKEHLNASWCCRWRMQCHIHLLHLCSSPCCLKVERLETERLESQPRTQKSIKKANSPVFVETDCILMQFSQCQLQTKWEQACSASLIFHPQIVTSAAQPRCVRSTMCEARSHLQPDNGTVLFRCIQVKLPEM